MFFSGLFQRKSDAPVTTPAELADAIGLSYDTYTGKQISSQRAMRLTAVFSCVRVLAESVGMLPCNLYHLNGSLKQRATGERLHKLISTHPNGYMTPQEFCGDSVYRVKRQRDLNGARRFLLLECTELGECRQSHGGNNDDFLFAR